MQSFISLISNYSKYCTFPMQLTTGCFSLQESFDATRVRVRTSVAENGICQVVKYINKVMSNDSMGQNETTFFPSNEALTAAEKIRNDTCSWVSCVCMP